MTTPADRPPGRRLGDQLQLLDATRFTGRQDILAAIEERLHDPAGGGVIFVHGPGGIGKSALLRELYRRARAQGVEAAYLQPSEVGVVTAEHRLLLIDTLPGSGAALQAQVLAELPASTVVVIAGRERPGAEWFRNGWEHIVSEVALRPLNDEESDTLLARHAVDGDTAARLRDRADGSPLALHVGATSVGEPLAGELVASIAHRLVGDDLGELDAVVLAVAAIAGDVSPELVAGMLPGRDIGAGLAQLRRLSTAAALGAPRAIPAILRDGVRSELRRRDPNAYRTLVVRIADHLYQRLVAGEYWLMDNLTALIEDPVVRWGYSKGTLEEYSVSPGSTRDAREAGDALHARGTRWWAGVERFFHEAPDAVTVVRDRRDRLAGFSIVTTPAKAPGWAEGDVILGPALAHAREHRPEGDAVFFRDSFDLTAAAGGDPNSQVVALLNSPPQLAEDLPYAQRFYGVVALDNAPARELALAVGAVEVPELSVIDGERRLGTYVLDHGPGGVAAAVRAIVRSEQAQPLSSRPSALPAGADQGAVRKALRDFHDPVALAGHPFAAGVDVPARAESVRALLYRAVSDAFGQSPPERQLRRLVELGYLVPDGGHHRAMSAEHLSRSTYFRRLGIAVERVSDVLDRPG